MKMQVVQDDLEIQELMQIQGSYKCDSSQINKLIMDRIKRQKVEKKDSNQQINFYDYNKEVIYSNAAISPKLQN